MHLGLMIRRLSGKYFKNVFLEDATDILIKSWSCDTSKQYLPHNLRWCDFCSSQNVNPFNASINDDAEFPTYFFPYFLLFRA